MNNLARRAFLSIAVLLLFRLDLRAASAEEQREVALTFDDLPHLHEPLAGSQHAGAGIPASLKARGIPAIGFVNEKGLYRRNEVDERIDTLRSWLDAGLDLGNHNFGHVGIDSTPLPLYQENIVRGETVTRMLLAERGRELRYYRHTQLRTGPTDEYRTALSAFLAQRGYTVAPVTIDTQDYMFAAVYAEALRVGDEALRTRVKEAYLKYSEENLAFFDDLSIEALGRPVKHISLLHANRLNTDVMDELLDQMVRRGFRFITLDEALRDPAYARPEQTHKRGLSWLHRWMLQDGRPMRDEPREPEWVRTLVKEIRDRERPR